MSELANPNTQLVLALERGTRSDRDASQETGGGAVTSRPSDRRHRKHLGAFYSPRLLVEPMVEWAVTDPDQSLLDPACGDGVFLETSARHLRHLGANPANIARQIRGWDLNPQAVAVTSRALRAVVDTHEPNLECMDFFSLAAPVADNAAVDVVVGNPPYIRYQNFSGPARERALRRTREAGVELPRLASSWAHFVVHAVRFLKVGGRMALILPAELAHASYAAPVRAFLRHSFAEVSVISLRTTVFPDTQEGVVILLAAERGAAHRFLALVDVEEGQTLRSMAEILARAERFPAGNEPRKWMPDKGADPGMQTLDRLETSGSLCQLSQVGKANIGFVSGSNEFFVLSPKEAAARKLPGSNLLDAVIRARQVPSWVLTKRDIDGLRARNDRCLLWLPRARLSASERAFVAYGDQLGIASRYKCRMRTPWYVVPGVLVPDAFLTYMSDYLPRLCFNAAGAVAANTLLTVRLPAIPKSLRRAFVVAFYNSATALSCERTGRSYGGGVLKLEPREADRIVTPSVELVRRAADQLESFGPKLAQALQGGVPAVIDHAIAAIDRILFERTSLVARDFEELTRSRHLLADRRLGKGAGRGRVMPSVLPGIPAA